MPCNTCAKPFSLLRKEKGCPGCGFSYCSKCLVHKMYLQKINADAKVCAKCKTLKKIDIVQPPDAYLKRIEKNNETNNQYLNPSNQQNTTAKNPKDLEIFMRLQKLRENQEPTAGTSNQEIEERIKNLKGVVKTATDEELRNRLDKLSGNITSSKDNKQVLTFSQNTKTEQEQADDLMKQYLDQTKIDVTYKDEFDKEINSMVLRLQNIKGDRPEESKSKDKEQSSSEDEEETVRKIVEKLKAESALEKQETSEIDEKTDELPFCEICNEDATRRCCGCKYLFCKRCFNEHKDDDEDCNQYENYAPPKNKSLY